MSDAEGRSGLDAGIGERPTAVGTATQTLAARMAAVALGFIASLMLARALGPTGRGEYIFPIFLVMVFTTIGHLTYESVNIHFLATRAGDERTLAQATFAISALSAACACVGLAALAVGANSLLEDVGGSLMFVAAVALPLRIQQYALSTMLQLTFRARAVNLATIANAVVQLAAVATLWASGHLTPFTAVLSYTGATAVGWLWSMAALRPPVGWPGRALVERALRYSARIHGGTILTTLVVRGDVFIVQLYRSSADVGIYTLAVVTAEVVNWAVEAITAAANPRQARPEREEMADLAMQLARISVVVLGAIAIVLAAVSPILVPVLFGSSFAPVALLLMALLPGVVAYGSYRPLMVFMLRRERPSRLTAIAAVGLALNITANVVLIRHFGLISVAFVSSATYVVMYVMVAHWFLRDTGNRAMALVPRVRDIKLIAELVRASLRSRGVTAAGSS